MINTLITNTRVTLAPIDNVVAPAEMARVQFVRGIHRHGHSPVMALFHECPRRERTREVAAWSEEASNACWTA